MNRRIVFNMLGEMCLLEAALLLVPVLIGIIFGNISDLYAFGLTIVVALVVGLPMRFLSKPREKTMYSKEGYVICVFTWIILSLIGALPFCLSGKIPSYIDAFFETVSGFTTTGSSIIPDLTVFEGSEALLFWRSFTHFLGGMGVLVFLMMLTKDRQDRGIHIMRAEMPGPIIDKLMPRAGDTAKILYLIYFVISFAEFIFLWAGEMTWFEALIHTMSTAGTGGFGMYGDSITSFSPYTQWVITVFMFLFGMNFNFYFLILIRKVKSVLKSTELWVYVSVAVIAVVIISINIHSMYSGIPELVRTSAFQVASIMTTTGFTTTDFATWPELSKQILLLLMFIGACAGSTAGGIKVSRVIIIMKSIRREIRHLLHPKTVKNLMFEGKRLDENTIKGVLVYLGIYVLSLVTIFLLLGFDKFDFGTNFVLTMTTFNNIGPAMGMFGAYDSLASLSAFSKIVLSVSMLLGRLEILPLFIAFSPATWSRKN